MSAERLKATLNLGSPKIRRDMLHGREHIVAPLSMIVHGVLNGSKGSLYYPEKEIGKNPSDWNGMPIVDYHPVRNGRNVSARDPDILNAQGIGVVLRAKAGGGKLRAEGWFDVEKTRLVNPMILQALNAGKAIELSTGLYTEDKKAPAGSNYNGKPYDFVATNYKPDHLAILIDQTGACSLRDGCGVLVNSEGEWVDRITKDMFKPGFGFKRFMHAKNGKLGFRYLVTHGGSGSGNFSHAGRPGEQGGSGAGGGGKQPVQVSKKGVKATGKSDKSDKNRKLTIEGATKLLASKGYKLIGGSHYDLAKLTAYYHVEKPDGTKAVMSSHEIKSLVGNSLEGMFNLTIQDEKQTLWQKLGEMIGITAPKPADIIENAEPGEAEAATKKADDATKEAKTKKDHAKAARMHGKAADKNREKSSEHAEAGNSYPLASAYSQQADRHGDMAKQHAMKACGVTANLETKTVPEEDGQPGSSVTNEEGEPDMATKLNDVQRKKLVDNITTNCDCWKDAEDRETLNAMSDEKLTKLSKHVNETSENTLIANAARTAFPDLEVNAMPPALAKAAGKKGKGKKKDEEDDEDDEDEEDEKPTKNASRLTDEEKEDLAFARQVKNQQKQVLINQLVANVEDDDERAAYAKELGQESLTKLQRLSKLIPVKNEEQEEQHQRPAFYGGAAAAAGPSTNRRNFDPDDMLDMPTVNYSDWADSRQKTA